MNGHDRHTNSLNTGSGNHQSCCSSEASCFPTHIPFSWLCLSPCWCKGAPKSMKTPLSHVPLLSCPLLSYSDFSNASQQASTPLALTPLLWVHTFEPHYSASSSSRSPTLPYRSPRRGRDGSQDSDLKAPAETIQASSNKQNREASPNPFTDT